MGKVKYLAASEDGGAEAVLAGAVGVVFSLFQCTAEGSAEWWSGAPRTGARGESSQGNGGSSKACR